MAFHFCLLIFRVATMKLITAIIKPFKQDDVREALSELGIAGVTVTEVKVWSPKRSHRNYIEGQNMWLIFCLK